MDLKEIPASNQSPYRCYVRGSGAQTEGEHIKTIGFKDGIAVVQSLADMQKPPDIADIRKPIDLLKLKKLLVKLDPNTGKKYITKDGKRIEINLRPPEPSPPALHFLPRLVPKGAALQPAKMRILENVKYHVVSMNVRKPLVNEGRCDRDIQTDSVERREVCTQTDTTDGRESPVNLIKFILGNDVELYPDRKMIDPQKITTKEEMQKFNFFNDMRNAVNFDSSGNLPIHDSVMQNNLKAVQKNCVVLKAVKESVNIFNQNQYAPLHLAIMNDVSLDIIKALLNHGADLQVSDPEGNTAIHLAIEHRRCSMLRILINHAKTINFNVDVFNYEGFTPLILACQYHSFDEVQWLLEAGANPNIRDMKSGRTALFHAAEEHDVSLVDLLMHYRADTKIRNFFGTSPHDAMFELDDVPLKIKFSILGRDHHRFQNKKKSEVKGAEPVLKRARLETTPVLRKVSSSDLIGKKRK